MKKQVTFTITADIDDIDFTDCGDGCGVVYGLHCATYKGAQIVHFHSNDVEAATEAMEDELGEKTRVVARWHERAIDGDRRARRAEIAAEVQAEFMRDPLTVNRRNG